MLILMPSVMANMTDDHLIASLRVEAGPLTSTPAEMELLDRLEAAIDQLDENKEMSDLAESFSFDADDLRPILEAHPADLDEIAKMLTLLNDAEIMNAEQLKGLIHSPGRAAGDAAVLSHSRAGGGTAAGNDKGGYR